VRIGVSLPARELLDDLAALRAFAEAAEATGRDPAKFGTEAGVAVVGPREHEWQSRVANWTKIGLTHLCLRTLGGGLAADQHIVKLRQTAAELPIT